MVSAREPLYTFIRPLAKNKTPVFSRCGFSSRSREEAPPERKSTVHRGHRRRSGLMTARRNLNRDSSRPCSIMPENNEGNEKHERSTGLRKNLLSHCNDTWRVVSSFVPSFVSFSSSDREERRRRKKKPRGCTLYNYYNYR